MPIGEPILTIRRVDANGNETTTSLSSTSEAETYSVVLPDGTTQPVQAESAIAACTAVPGLHALSGTESTHITRDDPTLLPLDDLLDVLEASDSPLEPAEWDDVDLEAFADLYEGGAERWATLHRVTIDGEVVFGVLDNRDWNAPDKSDQVFFVEPPDLVQPANSWTGLLELAWDSAEYAGIGMAGYGCDGIYLIRPGLLALIFATDEETLLIPKRVARSADPVDLILANIAQFDTERIIAALTGDDLDERLLPGDDLSLHLSPEHQARLRAALVGPQPNR